MDFTGRVIVITGASSGIGASIAAGCAKANATLVLGGRNRDRLNKTAKHCQDLGVNADQVLAIAGDLTVEKSCHEIVDEAIKQFGKIDVLVNNAGSNNICKASSMTIDDLDSMISTHVKSVVMITRRAIPHLKLTKGNIVFVSSVASIRSNKGVAYGMAKAAVNFYSQSLAQELGPHGVRVNAVLPGLIDTPLFCTYGIPSDKVKKIFAESAKYHALQRTGTVDNVAKVVIFLASDAASFITGGLIPIDGGFLGLTHC